MAPALELAGRLVAGRLMGGDVLKAMRCLVAMTLRPGATRNWLTQLGAIADRVETPPPFDLVEKIYAPFSTRHLTVDQRANLLADHYWMLNRLAGPAVADALWRGDRLTLAELSGRDGCYVVTLARLSLFKSEGEMTFSLHPEGRPDRPLANLSVTLGAVDGKSPARVWIGGLQACRGVREDVVRATRDLGGLRPKTVLMEAVWALTHALAHRGMAPQSLVAVSRENHAIGRDGPRPDYDAFWIECGGVRRAGGDFALSAWAPLSPAGLSGKRATRWRTRLQVRQHLREGLFQWMAWPAPCLVADNRARADAIAHGWTPSRRQA